MVPAGRHKGSFKGAWRGNASLEPEADGAVSGGQGLRAILETQVRGRPSWKREWKQDVFNVEKGSQTLCKRTKQSVMLAREGGGQRATC